MAESIVIVVIAAVLLLGSVEVQSNLVTLRSYWREIRYDKHRPCGGNVIRISTPINVDAEQLQVECNGRDTTDWETRFEIVTRTNGNKCIQFTSRNNKKYALTVINGNNTVFKGQDCNTASREFLFDQTSKSHGSRYFFYQHIVTRWYLTCVCDGRDGLYLIDGNPSTTRGDLRLRFQRIKSN